MYSSGVHIYMRVLTLGIVLALLSGASAQAEERKTAPSYIPPVLEEEEEVKRPTPEDLAIPLNAPAPATIGRWTSRLTF